MDATLSPLTNPTPLEKFVARGKVDGTNFSVTAYRETNMMSNKFWVTINIKNTNIDGLSEEAMEAVCKIIASRIAEADSKSKSDDRVAFAERTPCFVVSVMAENARFKVDI